MHHGVVVSLGALGIAVLFGCRGDDRLRGADEDERRRRAGQSMLGDERVVGALVTPETPERIVYTPAPDLSLANARRMRLDIVGQDTASRRTGGAGSATRGGEIRDTTGGDAARDTSGGAARRRGA